MAGEYAARLGRGRSKCHSHWGPWIGAEQLRWLLQQAFPRWFRRVYPLRQLLSPYVACTGRPGTSKSAGGGAGF